MHFFYKIFIAWFSLSIVIAEDETSQLNVLDSRVIYPSEMFIKTEQSVEEFSYANSVDVRDLPEMLDIYLEREKLSYDNVQAVILDKIQGIDNAAFAIICEGFLLKCANLRLVSLSEQGFSLLTKDMASTLCSLMRHAPQCMVDLSETEIRNSDVFPLLEEIQRLEKENYASFEQRLIFLRRTYVWDAENRIKCYRNKEYSGLLTSGWPGRHRDFHKASGLGAAAKKVSAIDLPYPISLVFGLYSSDDSETEEPFCEAKSAKLSLCIADCSSDEECDLTEYSSVDSSYLSHHMIDKYGDSLANVRYIWLENCGVDRDVLRQLYKGFLNQCHSLRVLSLRGNIIGGRAAEELINIWKTAPECTFVLACNTFASYENGKALFEKIKISLPDEKDYELAVQKIILMDEVTLTLASDIALGQRWEAEKLWPAHWKERHYDFWKTYASKRNRILESLVSEDGCD